MTKVPPLDYHRIVAALQRKGSHIRLQKRLPTEVLRLTIPAHRPVKRSTLAHILKQARLTPEEFSGYLG